MKQNSVIGLIGLGISFFGLLALVYGLAGVVSITAVQALVGLIPASFFSFVQILGGLMLIGGILLTWVGLNLVVKHGGKTIKLLIGIAFLLAGVLCAILAVLTIETVIGLVVFLTAMVFFLMVADWGMGTDFFTKFLKSLPVIGKFVNSISNMIIPKRR